MKIALSLAGPSAWSKCDHLWGFPKAAVELFLATSGTYQVLSDDVLLPKLMVSFIAFVDTVFLPPFLELLFEFSAGADEKSQNRLPYFTCSTFSEFMYYARCHHWLKGPTLVMFLNVKGEVKVAMPNHASNSWDLSRMLRPHPPRLHPCYALIIHW